MWFEVVFIFDGWPTLSPPLFGKSIFLSPFYLPFLFISFSFGHSLELYSLTICNEFSVHIKIRNSYELSVSLTLLSTLDAYQNQRRHQTVEIREAWDWNQASHTSSLSLSSPENLEPSFQMSYSGAAAVDEPPSPPPLTRARSYNRLLLFWIRGTSIKAVNVWESPSSSLIINISSSLMKMYQHLYFLWTTIYYICLINIQATLLSTVFIPAGGVNHYRPSIAKRGVDRESWSLLNRLMH